MHIMEQRLDIIEESDTLLTYRLIPIFIYINDDSLIKKVESFLQDQSNILTEDVSRKRSGVDPSRPWIRRNPSEPWKQVVKKLGIHDPHQTTEFSEIDTKVRTEYRRLTRGLKIYYKYYLGESLDYSSNDSYNFQTDYVINQARVHPDNLITTPIELIHQFATPYQIYKNVDMNKCVDKYMCIISHNDDILSIMGVRHLNAHIKRYPTQTIAITANFFKMGQI